jgi:hypothetical protein
MDDTLLLQEEEGELDLSLCASGNRLWRIIFLEMISDFVD